PLARDTTLGGLRPGATHGASGRPDPRVDSTARGECAGRLPGRALARRDLPCRDDGLSGTYRALQGRRSLLPQLDGARHGFARSADLRLSAVQQELQPVVLWA